MAEDKKEVKEETPQAAAETKSAETEEVKYVAFKDRPLAPQINISQLLSKAKDIPHEHKIQTDAEVWVPGIPDPDSGRMGLKCLVKKPSVEDQILIMSKQAQAPDPEDDEYGSKRLTSPEARSHFWKCVWELVTCVKRPTITFPEACQLMGSDIGFDIVDPLLTAIHKLQIQKPQEDDVKLFLDDFSMFPEVMKQLKVAHRAGKLQEYLAGDDEVVKTIKDWVRTMNAVQEIVKKEDAAVYAEATAHKTIQKLSEALTPADKRE
jgi:hypothetical protein